MRVTAERWQSDLAAERAVVDRALRAELARCRGVPRQLRRAMAHSLFGGAKRLRPILVLWTYDALAGGRDRGTCVARRTTARVAAAIEMIHTYSLIHDDLPAMDDDVLRRGRPTCHVVFGEGTAILAGDGLQALAFAVLGSAGPRVAELGARAAAAAGPAGMVGGQQLDLEAEGRPVTIGDVRRIHAGKTAAMIGLALAAGGICRGVGASNVERLAAAGRWLGLAFQGADDLLDVTASPAELGKTPGKDAASGKATWIRVEGVVAARARTTRYGRRGLRELAGLLPPGPAADRLLALVRWIWQRDR